MTLVRIDGLSLNFGDQVILRDAEFAIEPGERVCLIGRNGAGKTSLLRLVDGTLSPDQGEIQYLSDIRISRLGQALPQVMGLTARETVAEGLAAAQVLREEYDRLSQSELDRKRLRELEALQHRIDAQDGWNIPRRVDTVLTEMKIPGDRRMADLSGGWRRRVALARALVNRPDLLLLDEPTNHLDLASIQWLEDRIASYPGSVLFVTHDRAFLDRLATRIVEIDRGALASWPGGYRDFLRRKDASIMEEDRRNAEFDKKLAEEEAWIRQGIKARRTRNEGRVRALTALRTERAARVKRPGHARIRIDQADPSGRKVISAHNVVYGYGDEKLIDGLSLKVTRGDRIGLVGNNGVGKSTLLRILLGEIEPQSGTVKHGTNLAIGYFDQLRQSLELDKSVAYNVGEGKDHVTINGNSQHVVGYLTGFLFSAKRAMTSVAALSGGERNRVILAKLFTQPTNLLVLDEPTNDLDVETLEVLEQRLAEYQGTLIVVSHDREFLDNVVTSILVFEAGGRIQEYVGGYSDWVRRGLALEEIDDPNRSVDRRAKQPRPDKSAGSPAKLSYKLQRELDGLPDRIEALEHQIAELQARLAVPGFYAQSFDKTQPVLSKLSAVTCELDTATERWLELEDRQQAYLAARAGPPG